MPNLNEDAQLLKQVLNEFAHLINSGQWDLDNNPNIKKLVDDLFQKTADKQLKTLTDDNQAAIDSVIANLNQNAQETAKDYANDFKNDLANQLTTTTKQIRNIQATQSKVESKTQELKQAADDLQDRETKLRKVLEANQQVMAQAESTRKLIWQYSLFGSFCGGLIVALFMILLYVPLG